MMKEWRHVNDHDDDFRKKLVENFCLMATKISFA